MKSRKKLHGLLFVFLMGCITTLEARIPMQAFKGVTPLFTRDASFYSPLHGLVGIETGFIENLRFYGNYAAGFDENGQRNYTKDASTDPLWNIVKILFPSNTGAFASVFEGDKNFARYVKEPQTIALLLTYASHIRSKGASTITSEHVINSLQGIGSGDIKRQFKKQVIDALLANITKAIKNEQEQPSLYPHFTTEQVLLSFFVNHFNTQEDIWNLLRALPADMVDKAKIPPVGTPESHWIKEDIETLQEQEPTLENTVILSLSDIFSSLTPYRSGVTPISNTSIPLFYNPSTGEKSTGTFPDCMETLIRHVCNLLLFEQSNKSFVLPDSLPEPAKKSLAAFYEKQSVQQANSGDVDIRSLWNLVVAGGKGVHYRSKSRDSSPQNDRNIMASVRNFITVLQNMTGIPVAPYPGNDDTLQRSKWVSASLDALFQALNPAYSYGFSITNLKEDTLEGQNDLGGDIEVSVTHKQKKQIKFSFVIHITLNKHGALQNIKSSSTSLESGAHTLKQGTIEELIYFLNPAKQLQPSHFLYTLLGKPMQDNDARKRFIERLFADYQTPPQSFIDPLKLSLKNVLRQISWDDPSVVTGDFSSLLLKSPQVYQSAVREETRGLDINDKAITSLEDSGIEQFKRLEKLNFYNQSIQNLVFKTDMPNLRTLTLEGSETQTLAGLERLPQLTHLDLRRTYIQRLNFTGLEHLTHLYIAEDTKNLQRLDFTHDMPNLVSIQLFQSGIQAITGLEHLTQLKTLMLPGSKNLQRLDFTRDMPNLERIVLSDSGIQTVTGLEHLTQIPWISLPRTSPVFIAKKSLRERYDKVITRHVQYPLHILWENDMFESIRDTSQIPAFLSTFKKYFMSDPPKYWDASNKTFRSPDLVSELTTRHWLLSSLFNPVPKLNDLYPLVGETKRKELNPVSVVEANTRSWLYLASQPTDLPVTFNQAQALQNLLPLRTAEMIAGKVAGIPINLNRTATLEEKNVLLRGLGTFVRSSLKNKTIQDFVTEINSLFNTAPHDDKRLVAHKEACKAYALAMGKHYASQGSLQFDKAAEALDPKSKKLYESALSSEPVKEALALPKANQPLRLDDVLLR